MRHRSRSSLPWIALSLCAILLAHPGAAARAQQPANPPGRITEGQGPPPAAIVKLEGQIDNYNRDNFTKRFEQAKATGAKTIIVDLDSYGGLVTAGLDISRFLKSQTDVRTVAFVGSNSKAISAGAMIALACDEIVMAPGALLGDCAPIAMRSDGGVETLGDTERAKSESPILADFRDSAQRNGYDPLLVSSMVSVKIAVHWVQGPDGTRRFVDQHEFERLTNEGWTHVKDADVPAPVDSDATLLTVNSSEAAKLGLAKQFPSIDALAKARSLSIVGTFAPHWGDQLVEWLGHPMIRMLLIMLFSTALWAALHAPGHGFAEVLAVIALALLIGVPLLTGYAQWWEIIVILIGVALLALELFVIPGFGITGILGIVCILFGLVMTFVGQEPSAPRDPHLLPSLKGTWASLQTGLASVVGAMAGSLVLAVWLRRFLPKMPYFNRLILTTVTGDIHAGDNTTTAPMQRVGDRFVPAVGAFAEAVSELRPGGSASFYDPTIADVRVLSVISAAGYIPRGKKLVVLDNSDNRILVRQATESELGQRSS
jgi:membrane-bound serine protease (ClpP class)